MCHQIWQSLDNPSDGHLSLVWWAFRHSFNIPVPQIDNLSVTLDILVFAFVLVQARLIAPAHQGINAPNILSTITRDTGIYFAVISTSHLLIMIMFTAERVGFFTPVLEFNTR